MLSRKRPYEYDSYGGYGEIINADAGQNEYASAVCIVTYLKSVQIEYLYVNIIQLC